MTQREIVDQQIAKANILIATWPNWKQNILVHSSKPTVSTPRTPVNNQTTCGDQPITQSASSESVAVR